MKGFLLDTHTLLWALDEISGRLSAHELRTINNPNHTIYVSVISLWEIAIKNGTGKLNAPDIANKLPNYGFEILPVFPEHIESYTTLPLHHRDPFDRMLVAQAKRNKLTMITHDVEIMKYDVKLLK